MLPCVSEWIFHEISLLFEYNINQITKTVPLIMLEIEMAHHTPFTPK